jgi:hypothetical protein
MNIQSRATTAEAEDYLEALADELEIPEHRYEQAETSYKSLGRWLNRENSSIRAFGPEVYSQGSFALGTVIAPISDAEEYDIDAVCEFKKLSKRDITQKEMKRRLGVEVELYPRAGLCSRRPVCRGRPRRLSRAPVRASSCRPESESEPGQHSRRRQAGLLLGRGDPQPDPGRQAVVGGQARIRAGLSGGVGRPG